MLNGAHEIWSGWKLTQLKESIQGGAEGRTASRIKLKRKSEQLVIDTVASERPELIVGSEDARITKSEVKGWLDRLQPDGTTTREKRDRQNFLVRALALGKRELGWDTYIPPAVTVIHSETNPFAYSSIKPLSESRAVTKEVWHWIESVESYSQLINYDNAKENSNEESRRVSWGLVLFSAITNDHILNKIDLIGLALNLENIKSVKGIEYSFIDVKTGNLLKEKHRPFKRIFLSNLTCLLIAQHLSYFGHPDLKSYESAWAFNKQNWRTLSRSTSKHKISLDEFIHGISVQTRLSTPSFLSNYYEGIIKPTSIATPRLGQLVQNGAATIETPKSKPLVQRAGSLRWKITSANAHAGIDDAVKMLRQVRKVLYKPRNTKRPAFETISEKLKCLLDESTTHLPIVQCLVAWIYQLHLSKQKKRSTLYENFNRIATTAVLTFKDIDLSDPDQVYSIEFAYDEIIENGVSRDDRAKKAGLLSDFHRFIAETFSLPNFIISSSDAPSKSVDANIISETEYQLIKQAISLLPETQKNRQEIYWIFVLGYRAGLRAGEASTIHLIDIIYNHLDDKDELLLVIRPNAYQTIKSADSRRVIPLNMMLDEDELTQFHQYIHGKVLRYGIHKTLVFGSISDPTIPNRDQDVFPVIHKIMRDVTGCEDLRFHHLRHSLANALLFAMENIDSPYPIPQHLGKLRALLGTQKTKKTLYFISQILGHHSPEVATQSYLHFLDYLAKPFSENNRQYYEMDGSYRDEITQIRIFAKLLGKSDASLRKWKERYGENSANWLSRLVSLSPLIDEQKLDLVPYSEVIAKAPIRKRTIEDLSLYEIETLMELSKKGTVSTDIDTAFDLPEGSYEAIEDAYVRISMIQTRRVRPGSKPAFRHIRPSNLSREVRNGWISPSNRFIVTIPSPHSANQKQAATSLFEELKRIGQNSETKKDLQDSLRFFYANHRASENLIAMPNIETGTSFTNWLLSLKVKQLKVRIVVLPTSSSDLSQEEQMNEWANRIRFKDNFVCEIGKANKQNKEPMGKANLFILFGNEQTGGGAYIRYTLLMKCIIQRAIHQTKTS